MSACQHVPAFSAAAGSALSALPTPRSPTLRSPLLAQRSPRHPEHHPRGHRVADHLQPARLWLDANFGWHRDLQQQQFMVRPSPIQPCRHPPTRASMNKPFLSYIYLGASSLLRTLPRALSPLLPDRTMLVEALYPSFSSLSEVRVLSLIPGPSICATARHAVKPCRSWA